jgi:hypothetical protein
MINHKKEKWIECVFMIEAMAVNKDIIEQTLKEHVEKLEKVKEAHVYDKSFLAIKEVENPPKGVDKAYSQVVEVKLFIKDLLSFFSIVMLYGPSSIEVLSPDVKEIGIDEMQNVANALAGLIHQFAQAGVGGIVMTPKK